MSSKALLLASAFLAIATAHAETRRFALVVGNNAGAERRLPLRYAESDAGKMARVLVELGDVRPADLQLLQGRNVSALEEAIGVIKGKVLAQRTSPDERAVVVFYFSGHSDGEAIELGHEKLAYPRLKALLAGTRAQVRLTIVDACQSGAGLHQKGGRPAEPFTLKLSDALSASGEAFISSSAADESALESSEVMGSLFTHTLISGLRGAADSSGDKLITLSEAYRYAYDHTVSATAILPAGGQHPSYDYQLSGQGELVLASLLQTSAALVLPEGADRSLVLDLARDQVAVELPRGAAREVALPPGEYGLRLIRSGRSYGGRVTLAQGSHLVVRWQDLTQLSSGALVASKGGDEVSGEVTAPAAASGPRLDFTLGGGLGVAQETSVHARLRVGFEPSPRTGWALALYGSTGSGSVGPVSESSVALRGGYRWVFEKGLLRFALGGELGPAYFWQQDLQSRPSTLAVSAGPHAALQLHLGGPVWLALDVDAPVYLLRVDGRLTARVLPSAGLGLSFSL